MRTAITDESAAASAFGLACPRHRDQILVSRGGRLVCAHGCSFPIVSGIPRFVGTLSYADAFGLQWNRFRTTQHDSETGTTISRDRLERCLGGLSRVRGHRVLEAGCGSGRFTEILLHEGASVLAVDISSAIEVNFTNNSGKPRYAACQADVNSLPVAPGSFDIVLALGMIQHTPDPEQTIGSLAEAVVPGGALVFDHYTEGYSITPVRRLLRATFVRLGPRAGSAAALWLARVLVPLHRLTWRDGRASRGVRPYLLRLSPLVDYYDSYRQLDAATLAKWSILDTHDTLTDRYKHLRTGEQLRATVEANGLVVEELRLAGNGVEVRALKPAR
jgi:SAM-dependent methyltransferase